MITINYDYFTMIFVVSIDGESCLLPPRYRKRPKNCYSYDERVSYYLISIKLVDSLKNVILEVYIPIFSLLLYIAGNL